MPSLANTQFGKIEVNTKAVEAGIKVAKTAALSKEDVVAITKEYIKCLDEYNHVSAAKDAAALSESQLGGLAEALVNAQFSQKQESAAGDYSIKLLKEKKSN